MWCLPHVKQLDLTSPYQNTDTDQCLRWGGIFETYPQQKNQKEKSYTDSKKSGCQILNYIFPKPTASMQVYNTKSLEKILP